MSFREIEADFDLLHGQRAQEAAREFLFTYRFAGAEWSFTIFAVDPAEAKEKIKAVALARYDGEVFAKIPASVSLFGIVPRLLTWWRNRK